MSTSLLYQSFLIKLGGGTLYEKTGEWPGFDGMLVACGGDGEILCKKSISENFFLVKITGKKGIRIGWLLWEMLKRRSQPEPPPVNKPSAPV